MLLSEAIVNRSLMCSYAKIKQVNFISTENNFISYQKKFMRADFDFVSRNKKFH